MRRLIGSIATLCALLLVAPTPASAAFGLNGFDVTFLGEGGATASQAGSHPEAIKVTFKVNTKLDSHGQEIPEEAVKDLQIFQVPGLAGNPTAVPPCSTLDFLTHTQEIDTNVPACPDGSAVGLVNNEVGLGGGEAGRGEFLAPVYLLEHAPGMAARLGFYVKGVPITVDLRVEESSPYRIVAELQNISQVLEFYGSEFTLWGDPAASTHDKERGACYAGVSSVCPTGEAPAGVANKPLLTLPRACTGPLETSYRLDSWPAPGSWVTGGVLTHNEAGNPGGMTGCGKLTFAPRISAQATNHSAEGPTGLDFDLNVDDANLTSPTGSAQSDIRKAEVTLPEGVTINPSQAEGLGVCSEGQASLETAQSQPGEGCPEASKIGTVEVESPLLEGQILSGSLFVAEPYKNPFGTLVAIYMTVKDPSLGISITLPGKVEPDHETGQLVSTFENLPQLPFSHFHLHFREGGRSPLVTPPLCGKYTTKAVLTPWAGGEPLSTTSTFEINAGVNGGPCPAAGVPPFHPGFIAGTRSNSAGSYSPFIMRLTRQDGEQEMTRFSSVLPPGVVGKLAGVSRCPDAAIAAAASKTGLQERAEPSCPASSLIGHTLAGAGVGSQLTYVPGSLYLGGPYHGDPLSVVAIVPAVAGPFDVGDVVVREALTLNETTAEVEVDGSASDPIPHILAGIPLKLRELRINVDRPEFTLNPTSCNPEVGRAVLFGSNANLFDPSDDVPVPLSSRFQAANCASLGFKPKLTISLKGGTKRAAHPALHSLLVPRKGDANVGKAVVTLPHSEFIDQAHISNPCTRVQFKANECPAKSVLGTAKAFTPLLEQPLEGPVYFRSNGGERKLPDVVADLKGLVHIVLVGKVDSVHERIRTTFDTVPDAPVSRFTLNLYGGKRGLLVNSADLCAHRRHVKLELTGQNGRRENSNPVLKTACKGRPAGHRHHH